MGLVKLLKGIGGICRKEVPTRLMLYPLLIGLGSIGFSLYAEYKHNQVNTNPNYAKYSGLEISSEIKIERIDKNNDGYKETVLVFAPEKGKRKTFDLTYSNLERMAGK